MDQKHYLETLIPLLPRLTVEQIAHHLTFLNHNPRVSAISSPSTLRNLPDNGHALLSDMVNSVDWRRSEEAFLGLGALKSIVAALSKPITGIVTTLSTVAIIQNKSVFLGVIEELKRLKDPSLFIHGTVPIANGHDYPIPKDTIEFEDVAALLDKHMMLMKALNGFINGSRFHATTLPDLDIDRWLTPIKVMGGEDTPTKFVTPVLFGNAVIQTIHNTTSDTWSTTKVILRPTITPSKYQIPRPLGLAKHLDKSKTALETIWALDATIAPVISAIYSSVDKRGATSKMGTLMRNSINQYYSGILTASLELALAYVKMCDHASGKYVKVPKK